MEWTRSHPMLFIVLMYYLVVNAMALIAFARDKRAAVTGRWRTRERTLYALILIGGFIGAWAGRNVFRHKTRVVMFGFVIAASALIHTAIWVWIAL